MTFLVIETGMVVYGQGFSMVSVLPAEAFILLSRNSPQIFFGKPPGNLKNTEA